MGGKSAAAIQRRWDHLVTIGPDAQTACVWDYRQKKELDRVHANLPVNRVELIGSDSDELAFTGSGTAEIVRRSTNSRRPLNYDGRISYLAAVDRKRSRLFTTTTRGYLHSVDTKSLQPLGPVLKHGGQITAMQMSSDGRTLLTGSIDGTARLWNFDGDRGFHDYAFDCGSADKLSAAGNSFSPDGQHVAKLLANDKVVIERRATGVRVGEPMTAVGPIRQFGFISNARLYTLASGQIQFWRSSDGQPDGGPYELGPNDGRIVFSRTGQMLAAVPPHDDVRAFPLNVYRVGDELRNRFAPIPVSNGATSFSPDENEIASGYTTARLLCDA